MKPARGHNKRRTPPRTPRPEAVKKEMKAKETLDSTEAWEDLKNVAAKRKKL